MSPRRDRGEGGFTVVEMMVTVVLLSIVMAILLPQVTGALTTFNRQSTRSTALDQANLGLAQVQRDVFASGGIAICADNSPSAPSGGLPSGFAMVLAPGVGTSAQAVQYWVDGTSANLSLRRATTATSGCPVSPATFPSSGQSVVAGLANATGAPPLVATCSGRSIDINLYVTADSTKSPPATIQLNSLATGRGVTTNGSTTCT